MTVSLPVRAGANGKLFGSVTPAVIAQAVKKAGGPALDKRSVEIAKPIRSTGSHTVGIKLHDAVTAKVPLTVVAA